MRNSTIRWASSCALVVAAAIVAAPTSTHAQVEKPKGSLPASVVAAPAFTTINTAVGALKINVGEDMTFQIWNYKINLPGTNGQIYPSGCASTADMGVFARIGGTLYGPDFSQHPCGTATGGLGPHQFWTNLSVSTDAVSGQDHVVIVNADAGASQLHLKLTVTYHDGDDFFRKAMKFTNNSGSPITFDALLGSDLYLANSDAGIPTLVPSTGDVGGRDCANGGYRILHIPITPAQAYTARTYSSVWNEIGAGHLTNTVAAGCQDNGAALEWQNVSIPAGFSKTIIAATSFGPKPEPKTINRLVLLDQTGSMAAVRPGTGNTRCKDIKTQAGYDLEAFKNLQNAGKVAVWTFNDAGIVDQSGGFVNPLAAIATINALPAEGCGFATPLATAICTASDALNAAFPNAAQVEKQLQIYSDGGENSSGGICAGVFSVGGPPYDVGSWENNVVQHLLGNSTVLVGYWNDFENAPGLRARAMDPETGRPLQVQAGHDGTFFQYLATQTDGGYAFIADGDVYFPHPIVPIANPVGLVLVSLLSLAAGAVFISRSQRRSMAA